MGRKVEKKENEHNPKAKWMSIVLLIIMVASVAGFAMSYSGGGSSSSSNNDLPPEVPLQQIEQQGQILWFTVRNSELFVFEEVDSLIEDRAAAELASKIEQNENLNLYVDASFRSGDSLFLIERALEGERINVNNVPSQSCDSSTLILSGNGVEGDCMVFVDDGNSTFNRAEALVYHIVKD